MIFSDPWQIGREILCITGVFFKQSRLALGARWQRGYKEKDGREKEGLSHSMSNDIYIFTGPVTPLRVISSPR